MMRAIRPQNSSAPIIISIVLFGSYRYSQKGNFLMNNSFFLVCENILFQLLRREKISLFREMFHFVEKEKGINRYFFRKNMNHHQYFSIKTIITKAIITFIRK